MKNIHKNIIFLYILLSLIFVLPFLIHNNLKFGWDMFFHIRRINELAENYRHGNLYPFIYTFDFKNFGYPLGIFYPQITLFPFSFISAVYKLNVVSILSGIVLYNLLTLLITHLSVYRITKNQVQSVFAAIIYTFSTYRLIDIWTRFALGEFIALTFLPLVCWGLWEIIHGNVNNWPILSIGLVLTLWSHVLSIYIYLGFVLIYCLNNIKILIIDKNRRLVLIKSAVTFIAGSLFFVGPLLEETNFQRYGQPSPLKISFYANSPYKTLTSMINLKDNLFSEYNWSGDDVFTVGFLGTIIIAISLLLIINKKFKKTEVKLTLVTIILIITTTSLFPWFLMDKISVVNVIQFPFRILGFPTFFIAILGGKILFLIYNSQHNMRNKVLIWLGSLIIILGIWGIELGNWMKKSNTIDNVTIVKTLKSNSYSSLYYRDYIPEVGQGVASDIVEKNKVGNYLYKKIHSLPNQLDYEMTIKRNQTVILPVYRMKNLKILVHGKIQHMIRNNNGLVKFKSNTIGEEVNVIYKWSLVDIISMTISLATILLLICWIIRRLLFNRCYIHGDV